MVFLGCWFGLQFLIRVLLSQTANLDEAEQLLLTQAWSWGYGPQPPLYTWIQRVFFDVLGPSILALALLKNLILFGTYSLTYFAARRATGRHAGGVIAALSLLFIPQIVWESQRDLTHSVLAAMMAPALLLVTMPIAGPRGEPGKTANLAWYLGFGFLTAAGIMAKYNFVFWPIGLLLAGIVLPATRQSFLTWKTAVAVAFALALMTPHANWALSHKEAILQTSYKFNVSKPQGRQPTADQPTELREGQAHNLTVPEGEPAAAGPIQKRLRGTWNLFFAAFRFAAPLLALHLFLVWLTRNKAPSLLDPNFCCSQNTLRLLSVCGVALALLLFLLVLFTGASGFKDRWFQPILVCLPIWLTLRLADRWSARAAHVLWTLSVVILLVVGLVIPGRVLFAGMIDRDERLTYPMAELSAQMASDLPPGTVVIAETPFIAGNLRLRLHDHSVVTPLWPIGVDRDGLLHPNSAIVYAWDARSTTNTPKGILRHAGLQPLGDCKLLELPLAKQKNRTYRLGLVRVVAIN